MGCSITKPIWISTNITQILEATPTRCLVRVTRLGFRFAPRLRDLGDRKLSTIEKPSSYPDLSLLIGGAVDVKQITEHWEELLRLTTSLRLGTVTASLMLRKLASYPRQNGLAWALREVGRIEKTLFTLEWLQSLELRRRVQGGLFLPTGQSAGSFTCPAAATRPGTQSRRGSHHLMEYFGTGPSY